MNIKSSFQLEIIKSKGTKEEKENAIRLEKQFKLPMELRLRMVMDCVSAVGYSYPWNCVFAWLWTASPL
ncbi:unnamed protein product [Rhizophagus irregularis]|nr:unnamed protein product [Rhizophagus irregularis]CAB5358574.1 unnamed protein product [Rhizophagus irregularis]